MNIKSGINWTKSAIALVLLFSMLGLSAIAQTNPEARLDAEAVFALGVGLTTNDGRILK